MGKKSGTYQVSPKDLDFTVPGDWSLPFYPQGTLDAVTSFQISGDSVIATGKIGSRADSARTWGLAVWDGSRWNSPASRPGLRGVIWGFLQENSGKTFFGPYASEPAVREKQPLATWDGAWKTRDLPVNQPNNGIVGFASSVTRWNGDLMYATWIDGIWKLDDTSVVPFLLPDKSAADPSGKKEVNVVDMTVRDGKLWVMGRILGNAFAFNDGQKWTYPGIETAGGISWAFMGPGGFFLDGGTGTRAGVSVSEKVRVLQWDGAEWKQIALDPAMRYPRHLATDGQSLFLIGYDRYVEVNPGSSLQGKGLWISKWDGVAFQIVERVDFTGLVMQATYDRGRLFLGGGFNYLSDLRADNFAMWDGARWHAFTQALKPGMAGGADAALSWNGKLVFGGKAIVAAGAKRASGIAAWDGTDFETFGKGIPVRTAGPDLVPEIVTEVSCLAGAGGTLYAGGTFDSAGTRAAKNVARWDGAEWTALGEGLPGPVSRLLVAESTLYALSLDTNTDPSGLARQPFEWTGSHWDHMGKPLAGGFGALAHFKGSIWACSGNKVLRWRGTEWDTVPLEDYGRIQHLIPYRDDLLISAENGLFRFDGQASDTLAEVENASSLIADGEDLFAYGLLKIPGHPEVNLARWDGNQWHPMGYFGSAIHGMVIHGDFLYVLLNQSTEYWDAPDHNPYLRWNRKTGTWTRPVARKDARGVSWKALPCAQDCFSARGEADSEGYDLKGRRLGTIPVFKREAAGVRIMEVRR